MVEGMADRFERTWARWERFVRGVINRFAWGWDEDSKEDISQAARILAWRKFADYDPSYAFGTWVFSVVRTAATAEHRKRMRRPTTVPICPEVARIPSPSPDRDPEGPDIAALAGMIDSLTPARARVLRAHIATESDKEAAEMLNMSHGSYRESLRKARIALRRKRDEMLGDESR